MAFDIYGNRLYPGNCEVHPWITEEYPCYVCREKDHQIKKQKEAERDYYEQWELAMHQQARHEYCLGDIRYRSLCLFGKMLLRIAVFIHKNKERILNKCPI